MQSSRDVLASLCARIVPAALEESPHVDLPAAVALRIAALPGPLRAQVTAALRMVEHPAAALLTGSFPRAFTALTPAAQVERLQRMERSRVPLARSVFQALRRLIIATYYSIPDVLPTLGYAPPLHEREPMVPWEGPIPDSDSTVVARSFPTVLQSAADDTGFVAGAQIGADATYRCNVCVIGSGAGGAVAAARLAAAGMSVIVLEEGGHYTPADFSPFERDMTRRLYADGAARVTDDASVSLLQGRCTGGGTTVNWMLMLRPRPWVMEEWERDHGVELLGARSLLPALERIEREVAAGFLPDDAHSASNRIILDGAAALGWRAETAAINARGCVRAGTCGLGCRYGAKRSAGAVFLPRACADGARVLSDVRADRIELLQTGRRIHGSVLDRDAHGIRGRVTVDADVVIIAAGAIHTPALLQASGLGGSNTGRYLRLHPTTAVRGVYDRVMYGAAGVPQSSLLTEYMEGDGGYGTWVECPPLLPALASVAVGGFGREHRAAMRAFPNLAALIVLVRDGSAADVSAGDVRHTRSGRVSIRYRLGSAERARMRVGIEAAVRLHLVAGALRASTLHSPELEILDTRGIADIAGASLAPNRVTLFSAHVNGTCRMGGTARVSVCTPDGGVRGAPGVFVADGSLFPTAPGVNPQAAIMAMASLIADGIANRSQVR